LQGRPVLILPAMHAGDAAEGGARVPAARELGTPLLNLSGPIPYTGLQPSFAPCFPKRRLYYWKSLYLDLLDEETMAAILLRAAARPSPQTLMALWHLGGGAAGRVAAEATAFGSRAMPFMLSFDTTWTDPADSQRNIAWTRAAWADMRRFGSGGLYLNFAGFGEEQEALVRAGYGTNYDRLAALKTEYDPGNLFHMNQNIRPRG
jgi:hypothetical protein